MALALLDNKTARRLFLDRHALLEHPTGSAKGADLLALIQRLGFVQLDSINTVARAHDMILYSRRPSYRSQDLGQLYADGGLFEHWTHDAAVIPMQFYPQWHLRFHRDTALLKARWKNWRRDGYEAQFGSVLQHIRDHGPVSSSDVGKDEKKGSGGWWDWHPSKTALEFLWRSGALAVTGRQGFRKIYDLTERVIDEGLRPGATPHDEAATVDWLCNAALDRLGFATAGEIARFWDTASPAEAKLWCAAEEQAGRLQRISVAQADGALRESFARPGAVAAAADLGPAPARMRVLSPFDPALRDRQRAERLFGFHYRIEVFTPAPKRKYGYYVFPVMEGAALVGRIDMKAQRDTGVLNVQGFWPEQGLRWSKARAGRLEAELNRVRRFAGLDRISFADGWMKDPV